MKALENAKYMGHTIDDTQKSPLDVLGEKIDVQFSSFIRRKSSEI